MIADLTDAQRAQLLGDVAVAVAWSADAPTAVRRVAARVVPGLADWCIVDLHERERTYQRLAVAHVDPRARVRPLLGPWALDRQQWGVPGVIRSGERQVVSDGAEPAALLPHADPACERLVARLGVAAYVSVPLHAHARTLGALTLVAARPHRFDDAGVALAETIARLTALAVPGVRLDAMTPPGRRQEDLLAALSHELRTPLAAMMAWVRLARHGDRAEVARALDTIERNGRVLSRLVDELLDTAGILTGGAAIVRRPLDLAAIVERTITAQAAGARDKGVRLDTELDTGAGACVGDPARLAQVAAVLVANALEFTPPGGRVLVRLDGDDAHARLRVSDGGPGIAPAHLPHVFGLFRRATDEPGGERLALNLALARGLVELHGGRIEAASTGPGRGATFTVTLPRAASTRPSV